MRNHESFWKTVVAVMDSFHSSGGASVTSCGLYYHGYSNSEVIKTCLPVFLCGFCLSSAWCTLLSIHCDLSQNKTKTTKTESEVTNKNTDTRIHVRSCNIFLHCWYPRLDRRWHSCHILNTHFLSEEQQCDLCQGSSDPGQSHFSHRSGPQ